MSFLSISRSMVFGNRTDFISGIVLGQAATFFSTKASCNCDKIPNLFRNAKPGTYQVLVHSLGAIPDRNFNKSGCYWEGEKGLYHNEKATNVIREDVWDFRRVSDRDYDGYRPCSETLRRSPGSRIRTFAEYFDTEDGGYHKNDPRRHYWFNNKWAIHDWVNLYSELFNSTKEECIRLNRIQGLCDRYVGYLGFTKYYPNAVVGSWHNPSYGAYINCTRKWHSGIALVEWSCVSPSKMAGIIRFVRVKSEDKFQDGAAFLLYNIIKQRGELAPLWRKDHPIVDRLVTVIENGGSTELFEKFGFVKCCLIKHNG